jgi:hypothetical protein
LHGGFLGGEGLITDYTIGVADGTNLLIFPNFSII